MTDEPPTAEFNARALWLGLALGIAPGIAEAFCTWKKSQHSVPLAMGLFILIVSLWPGAAIVLVLVRRTRSFGLGMVLGVGLSWLALLAICGGVLR